MRPARPVQFASVDHRPRILGHVRPTVRNPLTQIERDLIAGKPLETLLRRLLLIGGAAGSVELREWASAELRGYSSDIEVPDYRILNAPLQIDGAVPGGYVRHQTISPSELPHFAREELDELVPLRMGIREIQSMVDQHKADHVVQLQPAGATSLVQYMNAKGMASGRVERLYWSVSTIALEGVIDQVRTRLAELIAELRSATLSGRELPSAVQASNAVNLVINGRGNRVNINQANGGSAITPEAPAAPRIWTRTRITGAAVVGLATVVATVIAVVQFLN